MPALPAWCTASRMCCAVVRGFRVRSCSTSSSFSTATKPCASAPSSRSSAPWRRIHASVRERRAARAAAFLLMPGLALAPAAAALPAFAAAAAFAFAAFAAACSAARSGGSTRMLLSPFCSRSIMYVSARTLRSGTESCV